MDHEMQADELRQFATLRDEGAITEKELQAKKSELLSLDRSAQPVVVTPAVYEVRPSSRGSEARRDCDGCTRHSWVSVSSKQRSSWTRRNPRPYPVSRFAPRGAAQIARERWADVLNNQWEL